MPIETADLFILKRPFLHADHEFVRGFVYLSEDAITNRIEEVDPSWTFSVNRTEHLDGNAVCHATLIIKDVARDGIGMQQILEKAGEPAKGAATDALKRCARLFGIGRYLLGAPKEGAEFNKWLAEQQKAAGMGKPEKPKDEPPPKPTPVPASPASTQATSAPAVGSAEQVGTIDMKALGKRAYEEKLVRGQNHFANLIDKMKREGEIRDAMNADQVLEAIRQHEANKDSEKEIANG